MKYSTGFAGQPECKILSCGQERERGRGAGEEGGEDPGDGATAEAEDGGGEEVSSTDCCDNTAVQGRAGQQGGHSSGGFVGVGQLTSKLPSQVFHFPKKVN